MIELWTFNTEVGLQGARDSLNVVVQDYKMKINIKKTKVHKKWEE